ncbi:hypothetical protein EIP91_007451 [Steccherinum ochraceum]|uniref:Cell cycle checkpoint control protein RAD9A n=1 Tax=Steccherinum ochraceum TaxID=92696 RepID=A0A4R0RLT9_9APHY|nr:hypothetical protein EIP91_007451 [Steccherinum ochraceum]
MQASLEPTALKTPLLPLPDLTKALTCLSKFGEDLILQANPERLLFHTSNSSATAYGRVMYRSHFFTRYRVGDQDATRNGGFAFDEEGEGEGEEMPSVDGQLQTKALLGILKFRSVEKVVQRCELSIVTGEPPSTGSTADEDHDSLESKLIVRLHCKHGVVKTHKLLLGEPSKHMAPGIPDSLEQSRLCIGPKAIRDLIDHFPLSKSAKSDPQLIWSFSDEDVQIRTQESSLDSRGSAQLSTELTVAAEEFDTYAIYISPIVIAFHLREFNAAIAFAESCDLTLNLRFTDPADPLFIEAEGADLYETLFIISMSQVSGVTTANFSQHVRQQQQQQQHRAPSKKRRLEEDSGQASGSGSNGSGNGSGNEALRRKPNRAVVPVDRRAARETSSIRDTSTPARSMPPPPLPASVANSQRAPSAGPSYSQAQAEMDPEPLFLPSTQLSQADQELIRESGLGIESMNADEFNAMMDDEGEEVEVPGGGGGGDVEMEMDGYEGRDEVEEDEIEDTQMAPTQGGMDTSDRAFRPLFDD